MEHTTKRRGNILILSLLEDLTFHKNDELGSLLHRTLRDNNVDLIVDMTQVQHVDSTLSGHFVAARRECELKRRQFGLANVPDIALKVLHTGGADHQIHVYGSTEEAIADISDRSHGTQKRRLVMDIKCGHDDCVYFTYGKGGGMIHTACEYPYQDDITNGPTCKCYKPDWQQIQENLPIGPSPFRNAKKKSLYEVRDKVAQQETQKKSRESQAVAEVDAVNPGETYQPEEEFEAVAARLEDPNLVPKIAKAVDRRSNRETNASEVEAMTPSLLSDDPFAVDNFPSSTEPRPEPKADIPTPEEPPVAVVPPAPPKAPVPEPPPQPKREPADTPDQVVRKFVQAWNEGDFQKEYQSLSARNRAFSESDYVARRQSLRADQKKKFGGKTSVQEVARVDSCAIEGIHATVEITRVDRTPAGANCYGQHYHLVLEEGFWKIQRSEDGEPRKNPIKPQKGRVMKASDFLGRTKPS
ncbi:MAG: STAS domain-containing protein [Candidatus Omnitrophica bacterium]|nr:STAS domain-containing protein [Candidatus Omnitrophota bacterium]MCA9429937.1 STAS domain-containing protein [Candidatus Omnitrophota bacterium]MCB9770025.1 STAS domain-containing protein [Candidatus Omnitrophota bacterium]MCB9781380.1 STAS domain-containing protein [Candidatus Omnitrophota bacterium]